MADIPPPALTGEAFSRYLLKREAAQLAAEGTGGGSPVALEASLASISDEVTAEAIERRRREAEQR